MPKLTDVFGISFAIVTLIMYGFLDLEQKEHEKTKGALAVSELAADTHKTSGEVCEAKLKKLDQLTDEMEEKLMKNGCDKEPNYWFERFNECHTELLGNEELCRVKVYRGDSVEIDGALYSSPRPGVVVRHTRVDPETLEEK